MKVNCRALVVLALVTTVLGAWVARPSWASGAGQLSSPGTYCTPPILISSGGGYSSYGSADQYVKFTIWYGTSLPTSTKVFNDSDVTYYTEQTFTTAGYYQTCIINNTSGVTTNFSISEFH